MEAVEVNSMATPDLESPALVEGLPGSGLVGMLAAEHLVEEMNGQPVRQIYSKYFPPTVPVTDEGTAMLATLTVYVVASKQRDILVLTGPVQAETTFGQYTVTEAVLNIAADFGVNELVTLGGAVMGEPVEDPVVVGAVTEGSDNLRKRLKAADVSLQHECSPNTIGGMSGLVLGLGNRRGFAAGSILGTTGGRHADPKSAKAVLEKLQDIFGFSVNLTSFVDEDETWEESVTHLLEVLPDMAPEKQQTDEGLRYLG